MTGSGGDGHNPFVGPRPIQQGEALHGREIEVRDLYNRLQARRIVVLHSPSGAGKSSLVQAGLIPRLRDGGFEVWKPIRVNLDPRGLSGDSAAPLSGNRYLLSAMISLEEGVPAERRRSPAELAGMDFAAYLDSRPRGEGRAGRPVVLLFDQFEELLTVAPRAVEEKRAFFDAVGQALGSQQYWALFILREDHLAAFAPYRDRIPTHMAHTFRLDLLGRDGAREAAVQLAQGGIPSRTFPAVDKLIHDLSTIQAQQPDGTFVAEEGLHVEPVHLQVVGRQLWANMPADDLTIDMKDIEAYADVSTVLAGYYANAVRNVAPGDLAAERAVREWVRGKLIVGGIRSQVRREAAQSAGLDNALVDKLVGSYLVRAEQRAGTTWFELSHDRLVQPIQQDNEAWERSHLHSSQVQARLWEAGGRARALLLRAEALTGAEAARRENEALWTKAETEFLAESRQLRGEEARRRRLLGGAAVVLSVALVAAVGAGAVAFRAKALADERADEAHDATTSFYQERGRLAALDGATGPALVYLSTVYGDGYRDPRKSLWTTRFLLSGLARGMAFPVLSGVEKDLTTMAFSADRARVATVGAGGLPRVFDARTGRLLAALAGHTGRVHALAFSPDGTIVATAGAEGSVRLFAVDGGQPLRVLETKAGPIHALAFSPDGLKIAIGAQSGALRLRDAGDGHLLGEAQKHKTPVLALAFDPEGKTVASAGSDGAVDHSSAKTLKTLAGFKPSWLPIRALGFSPDGFTLAVAGDDWQAHLLSLIGEAPRDLIGHTGPVRALAFSSDSRTVATAGDDGTARLWPIDADVESDVPVRRPERLEAPRRLEGHTGAVLAVGFVRDAETGAQTIATAGADGTARRWLPDRLLAQLDGHARPVRAVGFSPDGNTVVTASEDGSARLFSSAGARASSRTLKGPGGRLFKVAFSPDGTTIAAAGEDSTALLWRRDGGAPFARLAGHTARIRAIAFAPDGTAIATASDDGTARIWPAAGGPALAVLEGHKDQLRAVAFSPDSKTVATASLDKSARLWRVTGGPALAVLEGHEDIILSVAFSPDGKTVATASRDGTARLWPVAGGPPRAVLAGHRGPVGTIAFSPDGKTVATAGADGTGGLWAAQDGRLLARLTGHTDTVNGVAFSPDGRVVATASSDRTARLWDLGGQPLAVLGGHWDFVWGVAFSPDGGTLATASEDGTARLWQLRPEARPPAEVARQIRCRIPWSLERGALVPVQPDGSLCEDPVGTGLTASAQPPAN